MIDDIHREIMMKPMLTTSIATLMMIAAGSVFAADDHPDSLSQLIEKARHEAPVTVYAPTGKIVRQAKAFTEKYGVKAVGIKAKAPQTIEIFRREAEANNVKADLAMVEDAPATLAQLIESGYVQSFAPADLAADIPESEQSPLVVVGSPNLLAYNPSKYAHCPVSNLWQLTEPAWRGKVALQDPAMKPMYLDWFNQLAEHHDAEMKQAYQQRYGKTLVTDETSATAAFVKALAANNPLLTHSDKKVAGAVGAPDAKESFIGLMSTAEFRKKKQGYQLSICHDVSPYIGIKYPTLGFIAKGTHSPNAAKLFMRYLMTKDGIEAQAIDGKLSTNRKVPVPAKEQSGIAQYRSQLMTYQTASAASDWEHRQDWQDLWNLSYNQ
ncbi:ABC transporter substrate-binding protein [Vibrio aerogenes]